jgi:hypothetical protein
MTVRNYDPEDYMLVFAGRTITGLADGTPITAVKEANRWETHVGAQGEVSRSRNRNPLGHITVTLKRTSPDFTFLIQKANSDDVDPVHFVDRNTGEVIPGGTKAWVEKLPDLTATAGDSVPDIEFTIRIADYEVR